MKIAVYCGAKNGNNPKFKEIATELGSWMAANGHSLVYGAGGVGLMGAVSNAVLAGGGKVYGVIPQFICDMEAARQDLTELTIVETLTERKDLMEEKAEAYIALPGGTGTLEEMADVISLSKLDRHQKPCILYNFEGFYNPIKELFENMKNAEFLAQKEISRIFFAENIKDIEGIL